MNYMSSRRPFRSRSRVKPLFEFMRPASVRGMRWFARARAECRKRCRSLRVPISPASSNACAATTRKASRKATRSLELPTPRLPGATRNMPSPILVDRPQTEVARIRRISVGSSGRRNRVENAVRARQAYCRTVGARHRWRRQCRSICSATRSVGRCSRNGRGVEPTTPGS